MPSEQTVQQCAATYEELVQLEYEFLAADNDLIRQQYKLFSPLYAKRAAAVSKIDHFWALVLEQCPPHLDQHINPSDSKLFADCLTDIQITRPEIDDPNGSPRTVHISLTFSPNEYFEDEKLEKTFYFRHSKNYSGLVSEPVRIRWKTGKDITKGLTDAAYHLWQKRRPNGTLNGSGKKFPEQISLAKELENAGEETTSFFNLFGYVSEGVYVTAEESAHAGPGQTKPRNPDAQNEQSEGMDDADDNELALQQEVEICPNGGDIATVLSEDVWPHAIRYFTTAQEMDDDDEHGSETDGFEVAEDSDEDEQVDIRSLVQGKRKDVASSLSPVGVDTLRSKQRKT